MHQKTFILIFLLVAAAASAQNVGIGTAAPAKKLSVAGSALVDQEGTNAGSLDSAALVLGGLPARVGLSSNRSDAAANKNGLDLWTGGQKRLVVSPTGNVGIGLDTPAYKLHVNGWTATDKFTAFGAANLTADVAVGNDLQVGGKANVSDQLNINGAAYSGTTRLTVNGVSYLGGTVLATSHILAQGEIESLNGNIVAHGQVYGAGGVIGSSVESYGNTKVGGHAAVGGNIDSNYRLRVYGGHVRIAGPILFESYINAYSGMNIQGSLTSHDYVYGMKGVYASKLESFGHAEIDSSLAVGGNPDPDYRLRVYDGNARIGGDFHATGNVGISGLPDNNHKLRVWGGPSRFGGDVEVTGNLNVGQINGTGSVRSNGPSPLRIGFDAEVIPATNLAINQVVDRTVNITAFDGGADDVRVSISQFVSDPLPAYANWQYLTMYIHSVDPVANTAKLRITNTSSAAQSIKGTLYLLTVAKN